MEKWDFVGVVIKTCPFLYTFRGVILMRLDYLGKIQSASLISSAESEVYEDIELNDEAAVLPAWSQGYKHSCIIENHYAIYVQDLYVN